MTTTTTTVQAESMMNIPEEIVDASVQADGIEILAESLIVDSPAKFSAGGSLMGEIKTVRNGIKDALKNQKVEAQKKHKAFCSLEQKYTDPLDHAEELLKYKMAEWVTTQQLEEQEALNNGSSRPSIIPTDLDISIREMWKCDVEDLDKVPREYLVVDQKMLSDLAKSTKGAIEIDGIRFYKTNIIVNG
jgi:hypothetical protein